MCYYANKCGSFVIQNCSEPEFFSIQNDLHFSELFFRYISKYTLPASTTLSLDVICDDKVEMESETCIWCLI